MRVKHWLQLRSPVVGEAVQLAFIMNWRIAQPGTRRGSSVEGSAASWWSVCENVARFAEQEDQSFPGRDIIIEYEIAQGASIGKLIRESAENSLRIVFVKNFRDEPWCDRVNHVVAMRLRTVSLNPFVVRCPVHFYWPPPRSCSDPQ